MLSDRTIKKLVHKGHLTFEPAFDVESDAFQPASVDLRLGGHFRTPVNREHHLAWGEVYQLEPGCCLLGHTYETVHLPRDIVARVEGKSSLGRRFLQVHATAGFIDPGFGGQITLELTNLSPLLLNLVVGQLICQISFDYLDGPADRPYGSAGLRSKYQGQTGAVAARDQPAGRP